ncbi:CotH kinase family protein [Actinoplanes sp. NBC_00393]|uniref:CotH kinase family protein n=1 Tax=Actinoplanes sp. NBC_00393 TaxID=2975953 RepID=UPI002E210D97
MPPYTLSRRSFGAALAGVVGLAVLGACAETSSSGGGDTAGSGLFDDSTVHDIGFTFEQADYDAMIDAYVADSSKKWIEATVSIDGTTFEKAGLRLKGNSTLRGLTKAGSTDTGSGQQGRGGPGGELSSDKPQDLPWLVRLDKNVDGQAFGDYTEFVVRSNNSATALNEAVALELLGLAGLATQKSVSTRLSVNGGTEVLRLIVENPGDQWDAANFSSAGILYKAEADGDYSYRGDDAADYEDVFDQESDTDNENYAPLAAFLKFINQSDDATFAAELDKHLDVSAFTTYLAFQELIKNSDDIDGPGNNSYLRYTTDTDQFTVVAWDHNLAFGGMGGGGGNRGGGPGRNGAVMPSGAPDGGGQMQAPAGGGRMGGRSNILVTRFNADATFKASYDKALTDLRAGLYTSGKAAEILQQRAAVLTAKATDLVNADTITSEADAIKANFT